MPRRSGRGIEFTWIETRMSPPASRARRARSLSESGLVAARASSRPEEAAAEPRPDALATSSVIAFSARPSAVSAPGSAPPCPASRTTVLTSRWKRVGSIDLGAGQATVSSAGSAGGAATVRCGTTTTSGEEAPFAGKRVDRREEGERHADEGHGRARRARAQPPLPPEGPPGARPSITSRFSRTASRSICRFRRSTSACPTPYFRSFSGPWRDDCRGPQRATRTARTGEPSPPSIRRGRATRS